MQKSRSDEELASDENTQDESLPSGPVQENSTGGVKYSTVNRNTSSNDLLMVDVDAKQQQQRKANFRRSNKNFFICFGKLQSYLKPENALEFRFRLVVAALFLVIILVVMVTRYFHYSLEINLSIRDQIFIYKNSKKITFLDRSGNNLLNLYYGRHIPDDIQPVNCRSISQESILCYDWKHRAHLSVKLFRDVALNNAGQNETVTCYRFLWKSYQKFTDIKDCFDMTESYWFGVGDVHAIPLNELSIMEYPLITSHYNISSKSFGSIISRTWFSSKGVSVSVPLDVPLFVSINSTADPKKLCFISRKQEPYHTTNSKSYFAHLEHSICLASSINTLQSFLFVKNDEQTLKINSMNKANLNEDAVNKKLSSVQQSNNGTNVGIINSMASHSEQSAETEHMFLDRIIWSTSVNVLPNFTQQTVQSYVDQITNYGFGGIILLDSRWENSIGELKMNDQAFNNPKALVNILHNKGFKIMLTVSPNIALRSESVDNANDYIFLDPKLRTPLLTRCSTTFEICALINFTNPVNRNRFKTTLIQQLLNHPTGLSVDGLFFQSSPSSLLPRHVNYETSINPDQFVENMNSVLLPISSSVGITTSVSPDNFSGFVTLCPRDTSWQALQSIIPAIISLGLIGYPLVDSGVVGGRHLFSRIKNATDYTDKELYLRWLQVSLFLPVVQFAEPPGGNDLDIIKIAKRLFKLRNEHFIPVMKAALLEHNQRKSPIIRPVWWTESFESMDDAFLIQNQFMVGNEIVVAPIVEPDKTERDIYLPHGWWKDEILAQVIRGGKWMRKYQIPLDKVAFFIKTEPSQPSNE